ncbi:hypothetical protein FBY14_110171 [Azospirillum brasilense]|nr:hypothetical protein FBY14_110171 [Azospirillum brasilense]
MTMSTIDDAFIESRIGARVRLEPAPPPETKPDTSGGFESFEDIPDRQNPGHILRYGNGPGFTTLVYRGPAENAPALAQAGDKTPAPGDGGDAAPPSAGTSFIDALGGTARRMAEDLGLALSGQRAPADAAEGQQLAPDHAQALWEEARVNPNELLYAIQRDPADGQLKPFVRPKPLDQRDGAQTAEDALADAGRVVGAAFMDPLKGAATGAAAAARLVTGVEDAGATVSSGPAGAMLRRMGNTARRVDEPILDGGKLSGPAGDYVAVREATEAETLAFQHSTGSTVGKPPALTFNLDRIAGPDDMKAAIDRAGQLFTTPQKITFTEIQQQAQAAGIDEKFVARVLNRGEGGELLNGKDMLNALRLLTTSGGELDRLAKAVVLPTATDLDKLKFRQQLAFHGALAKSVKGIQSDVARTLAVFRIPRDAGDVAAGEAVRRVLDEYGGEASVRDLATKYLSLSTQGARNKLAEAGMLAKLSDAFLAQFINGLLSSPKTHLVNVASNGVFGGMQILERQLAAVIGAGRARLPGADPERAAMGEALAMTTGALRGFLDGWSIARRAWRENMPIQDIASRVEIARGDRLNPISAEVFNLTGPVGQAVNLYGKAVTLPSRAMLTEDEFFKAVGYRMELHAQAYRQGGAMFDDLIEQGTDPATARRQVADFVATFIESPPPSVKADAASFARTMTFQRDLESPPLAAVQQTLAMSPATKVIFPFFRTPMNIMLEVIQRSPLAPLSAQAREDFMAGGARRDLAIAKFTLGSLAMAAASSYALDGRITGSGPSRPELRQALERQGWQPYSFMFNAGELTPESIAQLSKVGAVKVTPEKVYVSYERFDPLSPLLAMAADMTGHALTAEDGAGVDELAAGAALAFYGYMGDQPFFTGFAKIARVFQSMYDEPEERFGALMQGLTDTYGSVLLDGMLPYSSLRGTIERYMNPDASNTMVEDFDPQLSPAVRGWYQALQRFKARTPGLSDDLEPSLDLFGRVRDQGDGQPWEMILPLKISRGKPAPADQVLIDAGMPLKMPPRKMDGVALSAHQYNRFVHLMNTLPAIDGRTFPDYVAWLGDQQEYQGLPRGEGGAEFGFTGKQGVLAKVFTTYKQAAKQVLLQEEPDLMAVIQAKERERALYGR